MMKEEKESIFNNILLRDKIDRINDMLSSISHEYNLTYSLQISENHISNNMQRNSNNSGLLMIDPRMSDELYSEHYKFFTGEQNRRILIHELTEKDQRIIMKCKSQTEGYEIDCEYILKDIEYIDGCRFYMFVEMEKHGYVPSENFRLSFPKNNLRKN